MASQKIIWTALPQGVDGSKLRLSVFIAPRLTPDPPKKLKPFPDFLNWPKRINAMALTVEFEVGAEVISAAATRVTPPANEDLWKNMFNENIPVEGFEFKDLSKRFIHSYSARTIHNYVKNLYKDIAERSPTTFPTLTHKKDDSGRPDLGNLIGEIGQITGPRPRGGMRTTSSAPFAPRFEKDQKVLDPASFASYGFTSKEQMAFFQANSFYERPKIATSNQYRESPKIVGGYAVDAPQRRRAPELDFHGMMAALADYPEIMRRLGIVVDLEITLPLPSGTTLAQILNAKAVRIKPPAGTDFSPWTYLHEKQTFTPRPGPSGTLADGMVRLENKNVFDLIQLDVDAAALKTVQFAGNMLGVAIMQTTGYQKNGVDKKVNYKMPDDAALPALRTSGIGVIRENRALQLNQHLVSAAQRNNDLMSNAKTYLHAEDLVRGYRIDVIDDGTNKPLSVCFRDGHYEWPGMPEFDILAEEGYVKGTSVSSTIEGESDSDLYLHETMFQWDGWSLCASRPGRTIIPETYDSNGKALAKQNEKVAFHRNAPHPQFKIAVNFRATPGTLPRLRFGTSYRLRARTVDLGGWSIKHTAPLAGHVTDQQKYRRFEPVSSPAVVLRRMVAEGESLEHMVIRSNYNVKASDYGKLPYVMTALTGKGYSYLPENERHIVAPKTSQLMAETHGMFDALIKSGPEGIAKAFRIARKEEGSFLDTTYYDPESDTNPPMKGIALVTPASAPTPHATLPVKKGDPLAQGQYVVHDTDTLEIPYLPDVFARGVVFRNLPGVTSAGAMAGGPMKIAMPDGSGFLLRVPFEGTWPYLQPFRLVIHETDAVKEPVYEKINGRGVLHVYLRKAEWARVKYSSYLGKDPVTGTPDVSMMGIQGWSGSDLGPHAERGTSWMLTPFRLLEMVHAVQQPLVEPEFYKMQYKGRKPGDTYVRFNGYIALDVPSTGKVETHAEWFEPVDLLSRDKPNDDPDVDRIRSTVFEIKVREGESAPIVVDCPDQADPANGSDCRHEFNDTKHRWVDYHLIATTRFREYFHPAIYNDPKNITRVGDVYRVSGKPMNVLSTARPDAPKILYVIPTYGWEPPKQVAGQIVQRRCGGGLRIYMDRPWYSSGEGEELGVVLRNEGGGLTLYKNAGAVADAMRPYITDWGMDPIWGSSLPDAGPRTAAFTRRTGTMHGLSLDELRNSDGNPYPVVSVAAHEVEFDPERKLWFCDLEIDAGDSYTPFIRLALARFQRDSIENAHLSRIVLADFAQLAPDRVAAVLFHEDAPRRVSVMVTGVYGINQMTKGTNFNPGDSKTLTGLNSSRAIAVTVEERKSTELGELGWFPIAGQATDWLQPAEQFDAKMLWRGAVTLPAPPIRLGGSIPYRLVIREYEFLPADEGLTIAVLSASTLKISSRVVYADTIELV